MSLATIPVWQICRFVRDMRKVPFPLSGKLSRTESHVAFVFQGNRCSIRAAGRHVILEWRLPLSESLGHFAETVPYRKLVELSKGTEDLVVDGEAQQILCCGEVVSPSLGSVPVWDETEESGVCWEHTDFVSSAGFLDKLKRAAAFVADEPGRYALHRVAVLPGWEVQATDGKAVLVSAMGKDPVAFIDAKGIPAVGVFDSQRDVGIYIRLAVTPSALLIRRPDGEAEVTCRFPIASGRWPKIGVGPVGGPFPDPDKSPEWTLEFSPVAARNVARVLRTFKFSWGPALFFSSDGKVSLEGISGYSIMKERHLQFIGIEAVGPRTGSQKIEPFSLYASEFEKALSQGFRNFSCREIFLGHRIDRNPYDGFALYSEMGKWRFAIASKEEICEASSVFSRQEGDPIVLDVREELDPRKIFGMEVV
jgi:hypothetical protein